MINSSNPKNLRDLNSTMVNQLVVISGIIVSAKKPVIKASKLAVQCRNCGNIKIITVTSTESGNIIPRVCDSVLNPVSYTSKLITYNLLSNYNYIFYQLHLINFYHLFL